MLLFIKTLAMNTLTMFMGWGMIKWALMRLAKQSDNHIDDNAVELIDALYRKDDVKVRECIEAMQNEWNAKG